MNIFAQLKSFIVGFLVLSNYCTYSATVFGELSEIESKVDANSSCPYITIDGPTSITQAGTYCLGQSFSSSATGITINADNVVLDLNGKTITGSGTSYGILVSEGISNILIKNGIIKNFDVGILTMSEQSCTIDHCNVISNRIGIHCVETESAQLSNCIAQSSASNGFLLERCNRSNLEYCKAIDTGVSAYDSVCGYHAIRGINNRFNQCVAQNTQTQGSTVDKIAYGFRFDGELQSELNNNTIAQTSTPPFSAIASLAFGIHFNDYDLTQVASVNNDQNILSADWVQVGTTYYLATGNGFGLINIYSFNTQTLALTNIVSQYFDGSGGYVLTLEWQKNGEVVYLAAAGWDENAGNALLKVYSFENATLTVLDFVLVPIVAYTSLDWIVINNQMYLAIGTGFDASGTFIYIYEFTGSSLNLILSHDHVGEPYSLKWVTIGSQYFLAVGTGFIPVPGNKKLVIYRFDPVGPIFTEVASSTIPSAAVEDCSWLTDSSHYYITTVSQGGGTNNIRVFEFNGVNLSLIDTKNNGTLATAADWLSGNNDYLAVGGYNVGTQLKIFKFNHASLDLITSYVHGAIIYAVKWLNTDDAVYIVIAGDSGSGGIEARIFNFSQATLNSIAQDNVVRSTHAGLNTTHGTGYFANVSKNMMIDNVAFDNDVNYSFIGSLYTINNRP